MTKRMLTRKEIIAANELFGKHLIAYNNEGLFEYIDNWNDTKIAKEIASDIPATTIGSLRNELFGKLRKYNKSNEDDRDARLEYLEQTISLMTKLLDEYRVKYNKLLEDLMINKVILVGSNLKL